MVNCADVFLDTNISLWFYFSGCENTAASAVNIQNTTDVAATTWNFKDVWVLGHYLLEPSVQWGGTWWSWLWRQRNIFIDTADKKHFSFKIEFNQIFSWLYNTFVSLPDPWWPKYLRRHFPVSMLHSIAVWSVQTCHRHKQGEKKHMI